MKKTVSIMLCLLLIFSSVSFAFASATSWDTTDQANLQSIKNSVNSGGSLYYVINLAASRLLYGTKSAANWLSDIENHLATTLYQNDGNNSRSIAWWVKEAVLDLDTIAGTGNGTISFNILEILNQLSYFSSGGARQSWLQKIELDLLNNGIDINTIKTNVQTISSDVATIKSINTANLPGIYAYSSNIASDTNTYLPNLLNLRYALTNYNYNKITGWTVNDLKSLAHRNILGLNIDTSAYTYKLINSSGAVSSNSSYWSYGTPIGNLAVFLSLINENIANAYSSIFSAELTGFNNVQSFTNWNTLSANTFTPTSQTTGLYNWLKNIQTPIARLAYVHASDEEISAREKAAANQTAVVNNFIDSTGSGAAPASSFGNVASMSSGYTSNMNTDAQASGIWNIFNSNNFGWFSQETANQLDTTTESTRKGSSEFETPLLDQQIEDIYKELGVDVND